MAHIRQNLPVRAILPLHHHILRTMSTPSPDHSARDVLAALTPALDSFDFDIYLILPCRSLIGKQTKSTSIYQNRCLVRRKEGEGKEGILWQQETRREKINQERGMKSVEEHKMNSRAEGGGDGGEARLWEEEAG